MFANSGPTSSVSTILVPVKGAYKGTNSCSW